MECYCLGGSNPTGLALAPGICCNTNAAEVGVGKSILTKAGALFCAPEPSEDEKLAVLEHRKQIALKNARRQADLAAERVKAEEDNKRQAADNARAAVVREQDDKAAKLAALEEEATKSREQFAKDEAQKVAEAVAKRAEQDEKREEEAKSTEQKGLKDTKDSKDVLLKRSLRQQLLDLGESSKDMDGMTVKELRGAISLALAKRQDPNLMAKNEMDEKEKVDKAQDPLRCGGASLMCTGQSTASMLYGLN